MLKRRGGREPSRALSTASDVVGIVAALVEHHEEWRAADAATVRCCQERGNATASDGILAGLLLEGEPRGQQGGGSASDAELLSLIVRLLVRQCYGTCTGSSSSSSAVTTPTASQASVEVVAVASSSSSSSSSSSAAVSNRLRGGGGGLKLVSRRSQWLEHVVGFAATAAATATASDTAGDSGRGIGAVGADESLATLQLLRATGWLPSTATRTAATSSSGDSSSSSSRRRKRKAAGVLCVALRWATAFSEIRGEADAQALSAEMRAAFLAFLLLPPPPANDNDDDDDDDDDDDSDNDNNASAVSAAGAAPATASAAGEAAAVEVLLAASAAAAALRLLPTDRSAAKLLRVAGKALREAVEGLPAAGDGGGQGGEGDKGGKAVAAAAVAEAPRELRERPAAIDIVRSFHLDAAECRRRTEERAHQQEQQQEQQEEGKSRIWALFSTTGKPVTLPHVYIAAISTWFGLA